ncbi:hypothetical protein ZWY2020_020089 [Hordeum vulgare]|uniref:TPX2 C-terminal domain-containing protein n=1 Tax=Hordeum vulgare subsp. vulgare TaxID=112509 RepID=A0A8I6XXQ1_HORVV|nr:hypothetical protein ZWY2020_020089 [Hordeum vulgare]
MATPAAGRRPRARRPFAAVASLSAARRRVLPRTEGSENVEPLDGMSFKECLHRFNKFSGEAAAAATKPAFAVGAKAVIKNRRPCSTPGSKRPSSSRKASRKKLEPSSSRKSSTPAAVPYEAPRAPLCDFSDEVCEKKVRARLSSPCDVAPEDHGQVRRRGEAASRKSAAWSAALEEAMAGVPEHGEGRVRYLVDTFERLLSLSRGDREARSGGGAGRRRRKKESASVPSSPRKAEEIDMASYPSIASSSDLSYCIVDLPLGNRSSSGARDEHQVRRCNSAGSSERSSIRNATRPHPFNLRTEQRGRVKEGNFVQRMREMLLEEERLRNPLAQGLPWTTDEPENLAKPPTKEPTEPFDVVLHSAVRAVGRSRFDHQIAERNIFLERLEQEKERQQKLDEEIEVKLLRKEQVPRAHPMPDFSRPFLPKRSAKPQTVPREPRFHIRPTRHSPKTRS